MSTAQRLLSRSFRVPSAAFHVQTDDGVQIVGSRLGEQGPSIVFCHGFLGWHRKPGVRRFLERLAARFTVYAPDLRGHGDSSGECTYGVEEHHDVEAVAALAREEREAPVVTMGISMGGMAVLRHAAIADDLAAVVSISAPASWKGHASRAMRRVRLLTDSPAGRRMARLAGYRLTGHWEPPEDPQDTVKRISPTPLVIVHGLDDHFFEPENAIRLYRAAQEPKWLMLAARFGHAEDGLRAAFAERVGDRILDAAHEPRRPHVP